MSSSRPSSRQIARTFEGFMSSYLPSVLWALGGGDDGRRVAFRLHPLDGSIVIGLEIPPVSHTRRQIEKVDFVWEETTHYERFRRPSQPLFLVGGGAGGLLGKEGPSGWWTVIESLIGGEEELILGRPPETSPHPLAIRPIRVVDRTREAELHHGILHPPADLGQVGLRPLDFIGRPGRLDTETEVFLLVHVEDAEALKEDRTHAGATVLNSGQLNVTGVRVAPEVRLQEGAVRGGG